MNFYFHRLFSSVNIITEMDHPDKEEEEEKKDCKSEIYPFERLRPRSVDVGKLGRRHGGRNCRGRKWGGRGELWSSNAHSSERQVPGYNDPRIRRSKDRGCTVLRDCKPTHYTNSVSSRMQKANHIVVQANMIPT